MIKERWYDLEYEDSSTSRGSRTPTVLYTSRAGLQALVDNLEKISLSESAGRHEIDIDNVDKIFDIPFTHVEIRRHPLESENTGSKEDNGNWKKPLLYIAVAILFAGFLSMYGLVRLVMDVIT